jgi:hypothetical protein
MTPRVVCLVVSNACLVMMGLVFTATPLPGGRATASFASGGRSAVKTWAREKSQGLSKDVQKLAKLLSKSTLTRSVRYRDGIADVLASMVQS